MDSLHQGVSQREEDNRVSRRDLLTTVGWGALVMGVGGAAMALSRFLSPNVVTPVPGPIDIGTAEEYGAGSLTYVENARAYVGRDEEGLFAIVATCTHLGCTPRLDGESFVCPCHGSRYARDGRVVTGFARRDLDRAFVGRAADGRLFVDLRRVVAADYRLRA